MKKNWKEYPYQITGESAIDTYELEELVEENFGDSVLGDSEQSWFYLFVDEDVAELVLAFVRQHGKEGEIIHTYGGETYISKFSLEKNDEYVGASSEVNDTEMLDWMIFHGAEVIHTKDAEFCWVRYSTWDGETFKTLPCDNARQAIQEAMNGKVSEVFS